MTAWRPLLILLNNEYLVLELVVWERSTSVHGRNENHCLSSDISVSNNEASQKFTVLPLNKYDILKKNSGLSVMFTLSRKINILSRMEENNLT